MFGECHAHFFMNGYDYKEAVATHREQIQDRCIRAWFEAYQANGVSFIRDGGDAYGVSKRAKELAPEYGIDYRTPIFAIHKNGHYGGIVGFGFDNMKEYHRLVKKAMEEGADFIKIMVSGIMDFHHFGVLTDTPLSREEIKEMIHIAHEEGMAVMAHANGNEAVLYAVEAGVDSIEHGNYLQEECLLAMARSRAVWVPTLATIGNLRGCNRYPREEVQKIYRRAARQLREGYGLGIHLALGSDAGAYLVGHGKGIVDEYHCFTEILGDSQQLKERLQRGEEEIRSRFLRGFSDRSMRASIS